MSTYSTGELAKLAHVSIRTLQYYDQRGLLKPATLTAAGRRQYDEADYDRLQLILLLKEMGLSLAAIHQIITSDHGNQTLALLLDQQVAQLTAEQATTADRLNRIAAIRHRLPSATTHPLTSKTDMDQLMLAKTALTRVHQRLLVFGLLIDAIELSAFIYGIFSGHWWPFAGAILVAIVLALGAVRWYLQAVNYVCPNCQAEFKPTYWVAFWSRHTPKARKLTCPHCHQTNFCVEVYDQH